MTTLCSDLHANLNQQQRDAVLTSSKTALVIARPGSGKTRVIVHRIAQLLEEGEAPSSILALTFTNRAAKEMQNRILEATSKKVLATTFHSFGALFLRQVAHLISLQSTFTIYDEEDCENIISQIVKDQSIHTLIGKTKDFKKMISAMKMDGCDFNDMEVYSNYIEKRHAPILHRLIQQYQKTLFESNAVDFDDLIYLPIKALKESKKAIEFAHETWKHILVDEYQDTNNAQYLLINLLKGPGCDLFVVGDPDQSIYSWRGANISNILQFEKDYPDSHLIKLEKNYRSTEHILFSADKLIKKNNTRLPIELESIRGSGEKVVCQNFHSDLQEAQYCVQQIKNLYGQGHLYKEMVILYRTNAQSLLFEEVLLKHRIPYIIYGGVSFFQRREIKEVLGFLKFFTSPSDLLSLARTINLPKSGLGPQFITKLKAFSQASNRDVKDLLEELAASGVFKTLRTNKRQRKAILNYTLLMHAIEKANHNSSSRISSAIRAIVEHPPFIEYLQEDKESFEDRMENLQMLISKASMWENDSENNGKSLLNFLEEIALNSAQEHGVPDDHIVLMTAHNSKGLEFPVVFLTGLEENLFPHVRSQNSADSIEEERRLCYVAMTRAKDYLFLTYVMYRHFRGQPQWMYKSRFVDEIFQK